MQDFMNNFKIYTDKIYTDKKTDFYPHIFSKWEYFNVKIGEE